MGQAGDGHQPPVALTGLDQQRPAEIGVGESQGIALDQHFAVFGRPVSLAGIDDVDLIALLASGGIAIIFLACEEFDVVPFARGVAILGDDMAAALGQRDLRHVAHDIDLGVVEG